ncbi:MAG TPA: hypothetical protein VLG44_06105 [Chlamydiales bacterium]|nr:hypothetical protein [Chlamydiales bacterium]
MAIVSKTRPIDLQPYLGRKVTPTGFAGLVDIAVREVAAEHLSVNLGLFWNQLYRAYQKDPVFKSEFAKLSSDKAKKVNDAYAKLQGIRPALEDYRLSLKAAREKGTQPTVKPVEPEKEEEAVTTGTVAEAVIAHKRGKKSEAEQQKMKCTMGPISFNVGPWKETTHPVFWVADITEAAYLGYEGALGLKGMQSLGIPALDGLFVGLSIIGGLLFILNSIPELVNGFRALANGDKILAIRMIVLASIYFFIGIVIFAASILKYVGIATFLTTNPWLLPVLYLIPCLCNLAEILSKVVPFAAGNDLVSKLNLKGALEKLNNSNDKNWKETLLEHFKAFNLSEFDEAGIAPLLKPEGKATNPEEIMRKRIQLLGQKMEDFQRQIGVTAGIEAFELMILLLKLKEGQEIDKEDVIAQIKKLDHEDTRWWQAQTIRLIQQLCVLAFFGVTMDATFGNHSPEMREVIHGRNYLAMCVERIIPTYMDICRPFERNTTLVTERVNEDEVRRDLPAIA